MSVVCLKKEAPGEEHWKRFSEGESGSECDFILETATEADKSGSFQQGSFNFLGEFVRLCLGFLGGGGGGGPEENQLWA